MSSQGKGVRRRAAGRSKKKHTVGAVVMKRRGAQARLKNALGSHGEEPRSESGEKKGLKARLSGLKSKTRAIAAKITKSSSSHRKGKKPRSR